jgi:uncharacterized membrane protein
VVRNRSLDLILVFLLTGIALVFPNGPVVLSPARLLLVLYLPGYALTAAVFSHKDLEKPERSLFSMGLSLAITAIAGLALHLTGWGIQAANLSALLGGVTLVSAATAWSRRKRVSLAPHSAWTSLDVAGGLLLAFSGAILAFSLVIARLPASPGNFDGYTLLWIDYDERVAGGYQIGIQSHEFVSTAYRLRISAGEEQLNVITPLILLPGDTFEITETLPSWITPQTPIEVELFRLESPGEPYRRVVLWPDGWVLRRDGGKPGR